MLFSRYIKKARLERNLSLEQVHKLTGLSLDYLKKMESQFKSPPPLQILKWIAPAYNIGIEEILLNTRGKNVIR